MKTVTIEECCEILDSMRIPITASVRKKGIYPYYGANGIQDYIDDYIFDDELVLLAEDGGNFGSKTKPIAYRVSGKCWVNNHAHVLKPKKGLNVDFLCYSLMFYNTEGLVNGATRQKLTQATMRKMMIPNLPMDRQLAIVAQLNKIVNIIEYREQEIEKLSNLIKSRFVEMFGDTKINNKRWKTTKLLNILEKGSSVSYGIVQTGDDIEGGVPVFRPIDIAGGHIPKISELKRTDKEISDKYKRTLLKGYELLITVRGSVGETFQTNVEFAGCNVGRNIVPLRFDTDKVLYKYMENYFSQSGTKDILASMTKGIALQGLNMSEFREIAIIIPPIELQKEFVRFAETIDKSKSVIQKSLDELEILKKSLMQKYFG